MSQKLERFHKYLKEYEKLVLKNAHNHAQRHLAEDIAQETFLKLYQHLDHLPEEQIKPWLLIVSSNIAKDYGRKGGSYETISYDAEENVQVIESVYDTPETCIERIINQKAARNLLRTALELLYEKNPIWYYIIVDSCMMGMSSKEIGKSLNLSANNVDVMKRRAREFLKQELGEQFVDIF